MDLERFEKDWPNLGVVYAIGIAIGIPITIIGIPLYSYYHIDETEKYKCYKYINYEHCEYPLFRDLEDLKEYYHDHPEVCSSRDELPNEKKMTIKKGTIIVKLLEDNIDSTFVRVQHREFLIQKKYYTLKCFIDKYSPEDFTF